MADISLDLDPISDTYGDLLIVNGDLVITPTTLDAIQQHILQRLRMYLGEWFLDNTIGLPFYQQILVKNPNQGNIDALFRNQILGTPGVISLNSYSFEPDFVTRVLRLTFSAQTTSGPVNYQGLINV